MQNDEENELKLHELSDQDSSSDDEEMEVHANTQVNPRYEPFHIYHSGHNSS